jgi:Pvc16 N-terminal domain
MIGTAMAFLRRELNGFFRQLPSEPRDVVALTPLAESAIGAKDDIANRILFGLTTVRQETTLRNMPPPAGGTPAIPARAPIWVLLHVVFASNFNDYVTGLDYLADVIAFFQARNVFDHGNAPALDPRIQKLTLAMINLEYSELSFLWGTLGTDFRPAVFYEVRLLCLPNPRPGTSSASPPAA